MPQRTIRSETTERIRIDQAEAARRGFTPTAFIRYAVGRSSGMRWTWRPDSGPSRSASRRGSSSSARGLPGGPGTAGRVGLLDALTKTVLTCIPEPPVDARPQAVARARERYDRLIKSAGRAMAGDAQAAMQDLATDVA